MLLIFNPAMMARHWRRWAKTKLQALLRAWPWRSAGRFEMWLWEIVSSPLGLVIAVSEGPAGILLRHKFFMWTTAIISMTTGSCSWCGSTKNEKLCRFPVGSGPLFLLSIFRLFLSFGNLQVVGWQATNGSFHWHVPAEEGLGWNKLINSILSCAQITQVLFLSEYQLFNFHHDWGGRSGERGWNSTFGKSPFRAGGGQGLVATLWQLCGENGDGAIFFLEGRCQR